MRSKSQFKSHPIHPMMVAFPVAFLYGAAIADVVGVVGNWRQAWTLGAYLSVATVATGLAAGIPGFIDYLYVVPPKSSAKRRATWHMAVNVSALGMMALGWLFRDVETLRPDMITIALEAAALILVTWGGWMGGTLVYRNQIGVDHRYAQAGKWREAAVEARSDSPVVVAGARELQVGQMMLVHIGQRRIVLARTEKGYAAFDDRCTHRGGSLADGVLACELVCCPWHGSQFNVRDGSVQSGPAEQSIGVYQVEEAGGEIQLIVPT